MTENEKMILQQEEAKELMVRFNHEIDHSIHVSYLSTQLFDELSSLHQLGIQERTYLECAAYLHDIGWIISHKKHHQHTLRLIMSSDLRHFDEREKRMVANIGRYHRKSLPKITHSDYAFLSEEDRIVVCKLASLLRVADGMDRTHSCKIQKLDRIDCNGSCVISVITTGPAGDEMNAIEKKKDLFIKTYQMDLRVIINHADSIKAELTAANC